MSASYLQRAVMAIFLLTGVRSATAQVALSNFTPRVDNLPAPCQAVYTRQISGCQASDFASNSRCSASCVNGLVEIQKALSTACANVDVSETSIIGVFRLGSGIPVLCPGVSVTTIASSSTQAPLQQTSSQRQASSQAVSSQSPKPSPTSSGSGQIVVDTSSPGTSSTTLASQPAATVAPPVNTAQTRASSSLAKQPSQTPSTQKSNSASGGGSPFDVVATGSSTSLNAYSTVSLSSILAIAVLFASLL